MANTCLTVRLTNQTGMKVGHSDPVIQSGMIIAQRSRSQGFGCSPIKVVRELGSERRETVRSLSAVSIEN
jgi:hypothetical protein